MPFIVISIWAIIVFLNDSERIFFASTIGHAHIFHGWFVEGGRFFKPWRLLRLVIITVCTVAALYLLPQKYFTTFALVIFAFHIIFDEIFLRNLDFKSVFRTSMPLLIVLLGLSICYYFEFNFKILGPLAGIAILITFFARPRGLSGFTYLAIGMCLFSSLLSIQEARAAMLAIISYHYLHWWYFAYRKNNTITGFYLPTATFLGICAATALFAQSQTSPNLYLGGFLSFAFFSIIHILDKTRTSDLKSVFTVAQK